MKSYQKIAVILLGTAFLSACGKEGPFGNTPGPKKPEWMKSKSETPEETDANPPNK
jgi:predicted small lipoprotein YifL